jgi:hypothetical protein
MTSTVIVIHADILQKSSVIDKTSVCVGFTIDVVDCVES